MPATPEDLFARLEALGIETTTHRHPAVFTTEAAREHCGHLPGAHCKNLFMKDKKGALWLIVTFDDRVVDMKVLQAALGSARLSFGKPDLLQEVLGVTPGAVTPFALMNDTEHRVTVALDAEMMGAPLVNYHPLTNEATTAIKPADLMRFIADCGHQPRELEFA